MTPLEAKYYYESKWPALNTSKEAATAAGNKAGAKYFRQQLSKLSDQCAARFNTDGVPVPTKCSHKYCPCCGESIEHNTKE